MIRVTLEGNGDCAVTHLPTGAALRTAKSAPFGGTGTSFSSTELLAVALASCIATDLEPVALRHGIALERFRIDAERTLSASPRRVEAFDVAVHISGDVAEDILLRLQRAADACMVQRALHPDIPCTITFHTSDAG